MTSYKGPLFLGVLVALFGAIILVGRAVGGAWLAGIVSDPQTLLTGNVLLGLMLCGASLALAAQASAGRGGHMLSKAIAAFVTAGAAATLSQDLFGWNFAWLGRMSPSAAYGFILIGSALWVTNWRLGSRYQVPVVMALGAVVVLTAILSLGLHATSNALHTVFWNHSGIAIYASIGFLMLGLGLIAIALARRPFSWSLGAYTTAGFAAGTAILLLTTWLSTHSIVASQEDMAALARSHEILTEIEEIEAKVVGLDNDQRAYLLDGNSSHLEAQASYINPLWAHLAGLRQLTAGDSFHGGRLDLIGPLIAERTQRADRSIETLRREGQAAGMASFTADLAAGLSAEIQRLRGEMERHEHAVLARFEGRARQRQDTALLQLPLGLLLSITIVAFGLLLLDERTREQRRSERTLRASETRLRLFVDRTPAAIAMVDTKMRYLAVSRRWLTDYRLGDRDILGLSHYEIFPEMPESWKAIHRRCLAGAVEKCDQDVFPRADGRTDWLRWEIHPWHRSNGEIGGIILFSELITERVDATERIRRLNRVHTVLSSVHSLIIRARSRRELFQEVCRIAVREGLFAFAWIAAVNRQTGNVEVAASAGAARARADQGFDVPARLDPNPLIVNDVQADPQMAARRASMDAGVRSLAALPIVVSGEAAAVLELQSVEADLFDDQEIQLLTELAGDIGFALQTIEKQERLDYLAYYDPLTGLPNRALFMERAARRLAGSDEEERALCLVLLDIERFCNVNETLGRRGGDELLKQVAARLEAAFAGKDSLSRLGADSFGVLLAGVRDRSSATQEIERKILASFHEAFSVLGHDMHLSVRAGAALSPADGDNADTLFRNAEAALKSTLESHEPCLFYTAAMNARAAQALSLEMKLRRAVECGQFVMHYQPKFNLEDGSICGLEALIRWQLPEGKLMPPGIFIPVLEQTGLIVGVGRWALQQALAQHRLWTERGFKVPRIAVNVSAIQLQRKDFADVVMTVLQEQGDNPDALELEITESLIMRDIENSRRKFQILRGLGVQIAMDDFGTGYSALAILARLPIDTLKIDRSFVIGMTENPQDFGIVMTIINLAHSLNLRVVAEGVETQEQATLLKLLKCDEAQGYLFSRPVPPAEIENLLLSVAPVLQVQKEAEA